MYFITEYAYDMGENTDDLFNGKKVVETNSEAEIAYWCSKFKCKRNDLIYAIVNVGNGVNSVDAHLEMNHKKIDQQTNHEK